MTDSCSAGAVTRTLTLATWNVLCNRGPGQRVVDFLEASGADVVAMQELSDSHVAVIRSHSGWQLALASDQYDDREPTYLGIATRAPVHQEIVTPLPGSGRPVRSLMGRRAGANQADSALRVDVDLAGARLPVMNLHLTCAVRPRVRRCERSAAAAALPGSGPAVLLGDFNVMARRWLNPLFAIPFGYRLRDLLLDERADLSAWAAGLGFSGAVDAVTFPRLRLQLDQVFFRGLDLVSAQVLDDRFGSDHRPVRATVRMAGDAVAAGPPAPG